MLSSRFRLLALRIRGFEDFGYLGVRSLACFSLPCFCCFRFLLQCIFRTQEGSPMLRN